MKPPLKSLLIAAGVFVFLAPAFYIIAISGALKSHAEEDAIIFGEKRIESAINGFIEKHGAPSAKIEMLIPEFLDQIPSMPKGSSAEYRLSVDGKWVLDVVWTERKRRLIFRRTNAALTAEETKRKIDQRNGCYVLRDD